MKLVFIFCVLFILLGELNAQARRGSSRTPETPSPNSRSRTPYNQPTPSSTDSRFNSNSNTNTNSNSNNNNNNNKKDDDDEESEGEEGPKFECPKQDGLFADPASCKRFYLCGAWHAYSQACPPSLYFDDKLKFCTFKTANLACGPVDEETLEEEKARNQTGLPICNRETCQLPSCFCSEDGTLIPGGLTPEQTPQFVLLGFSGAVNELVFDQYKRVLGYSNKFNAPQTKLNPNGCGIRATFFINHEYCNYAEVQWLASQGHEIGIHSITHRLPELWWTDKANYSEWAEEIIGMREILLKFANGGATNGNGVLSRDNVVGLRAPYLKPGGDAMFEMAHDFGLLYDTSIIAPKGSPPYWPFTFDHRQPFSCGDNLNVKSTDSENANRESLLGGRGGSRAKRDAEKISKKKKASDIEKKKNNKVVRVKRNSPYLGRPIKCPLKPYPGLWEIPINPLYNEFNSCPSADQCVFPSSDEVDDPSDILEFLTENFERHYKTNRAPFQLNFHVNWFTSKTKVKALSRFIDSITKNYRDTYFINYSQLINWLKDPQSIANLKLTCENKTNLSTCNRPHTCVLKHYTDKEGKASTHDQAVGSDTRYMSVCHPTGCPQHYPWYGNHIGAARNFKTVMQLVEEAVGNSSEEKP